MADEVVFNWIQPVSSEAEAELILNFTQVAAVFRHDESGSTVETAYNNWQLKQVGIIRTAITASNAQTGQIEAAYRVNFRGGGGTVQLKQSHSNFTWRASEKNVFEWLDEDNNTCGRFYLEISKTGKRGHLETTQEWVDREEFELLMVVGWYLCLSQLGFGGRNQERLLDGTPGNGGPTRL